MVADVAEERSQLMVAADPVQMQELIASLPSELQYMYVASLLLLSADLLPLAG